MAIFQYNGRQLSSVYFPVQNKIFVNNNTFIAVLISQEILMVAQTHFNLLNTK